MHKAFAKFIPEELRGSRFDHELDVITGMMRLPLLEDLEPDYLRRFPKELRLMIFEELLTAFPRKVFKGARDFSALEYTEFNGNEIEVPWQILATCRLYYDEAMPVLYKNNDIVFCTGKNDDPGYFHRFPVSKRCMPHLTQLSIYMYSSNPVSDSAQRIAHFIKAVARTAIKLESVTVLISSDYPYQRRVNSWDIMFTDHPVSQALVLLVEASHIPFIKIRLHDGVALYPEFAKFLNQQFYLTHPNGKIAFTRSCSCPLLCLNHTSNHCIYCTWPFGDVRRKPIDIEVGPAYVEADEEWTMLTQEHLFEMDLIPYDIHKAEPDENGDTAPYHGGIPFEDEYDEHRLAFHSAFTSLWPEQIYRFKGGPQSPKVWTFRQTHITEYYQGVDSDEEL
ncbi:hypothetical protein GQ44DRAFT_604357 [Phaeosphaeriaceae sp. PMI808]|nr:hypothetical protein GQ44DRAFT_604357 [Phaeosphaeriaceae sp. PMI808]